MNETEELITLNHAWEATIRGDYELALNLYDSISSASLLDLGSINNKGILFLCIQDYANAIAMFHKAFNHPMGKICTHPMIGVTYWCMGEPELAVNSWTHEISRRHSKEVKHTDEAGGVEIPLLLFWSASVLNNQKVRKFATEELRSRSKTAQYRASPWFGPLSEYVVGNLSDEKIQGTLDANPRTSSEPSHKVQFYFYRALRHYVNNDYEEYLANLRFCTSDYYTYSRAISRPEYHLARIWDSSSFVPHHAGIG
jgi:tetratricopeptide (TPR) repeat protein